MIGTIETRKVVTIELERSEIVNILSGAAADGHIQVRHDKSDVPMDCRVSCSNPLRPGEIMDPIVSCFAKIVDEDDE